MNLKTKLRCVDLLHTLLDTDFFLIYCTEIILAETLQTGGIST